MRRSLLITFLTVISAITYGQVTQLNSNKSLGITNQVINGKLLFVSGMDSTIWVSDGTPAGTVQLSSTITFGDGGIVLGGKFIFEGKTAENGYELFMTDGTPEGTELLKDILPGTGSSDPGDEGTILNGVLYFIASTVNEGRELWRTDGTPDGTFLFKDIVPGTPSSNDPSDDYGLFSNGTYLLFSAITPTSGRELYKSDGTSAGTAVLKDINPGAPSSNADDFFPFKNMVLFSATDADHGTELWKTDGTEAGTVRIADINPGTNSSMSSAFIYVFNERAFFNAINGANGDEIWSTDGTNVAMLKDINPGLGSSNSSLFLSIKIGNKLIFSASNSAFNQELWETDGTTDGTKLFKEIESGPLGSFPLIFTTFDFSSDNSNASLFNGKFFFTARTSANGNELWISDGTDAGTHRVKDINPDAGDGITSVSYVLTTAGLYFTADNGTNGSELWKSDGTESGTVMVADINPNADPNESNSDINFGAIVNNKIIFMATNGDSNETDLYLLNGSFTPLPVTLSDFTVHQQQNDALLNWSTSTEVNSKDFTVQRSEDGMKFTSIGKVIAAGNSTIKQNYQFTDKDIVNSGKQIAYYRLITTDNDGKTTPSSIITLKLKGLQNLDIRLLNNPVQSAVVLLSKGVTKNVNVSIKDFSGRNVSSNIIKANGQMSISVSSLAPGVYVLIAENDDVKKVIKFVKR